MSFKNGTSLRTECSFGEKCYRKNPHHFREFKHAHLTALAVSYPSLDLPSNLQLPPSATIQSLKEQLKIFCEIEKLIKEQSKPKKDTNTVSPKVNNNGITKNDHKMPKVRNVSPSPSKPKNRSISPSPSKPNKQLISPSPSKPKKRSRSPSPSSSKTESVKRHEPSTPTKNTSPAVGPPKAKMTKIQEKLEAAKPFNYFLTKVKDCPESHTDLSSIFFAEILHPSLGKLSSSLQINFMVELEWLLMCYKITKTDTLPLVILHGEDNSELLSDNLPDNIRAARIKSRYPYGTHHTKMSVLLYEGGGVRVVVMTANLVGSDWENRTQGVWVSDLCPKLKEGANGESRTGFKASVLKYLKFYEVSILKSFTDAIANCDMSGVNVFFVSSVPGSHREADMGRWGHRQVGGILRKHATPSSADWPVTVQCSSIGSLGVNPEAWMARELCGSLSNYQRSTTKTPTVNVIYPSHGDVMASYDGPLGGCCLPYSGQTNAKQPWLSRHLCRWSAQASGRTRAMPHIKTYTRLSPGGQRAAYFLMTSANLSKAAWGTVNKAGNSCLIMSYEAGILFIPEFITGEETFKMTRFKHRTAGSQEFPLHYDYPVKEYTKADRVWLYDFLRN